MEPKALPNLKGSNGNKLLSSLDILIDFSRPWVSIRNFRCAYKHHSDTWTRMGHGMLCMSSERNESLRSRPLCEVFKGKREKNKLKFLSSTYITGKDVRRHILRWIIYNRDISLFPLPAWFKHMTPQLRRWTVWSKWRIHQIREFTSIHS